MKAPVEYEYEVTFKDGTKQIVFVEAPDTDFTKPSELEIYIAAKRDDIRLIRLISEIY